MGWSEYQRKASLPPLPNCQVSPSSVAISKDWNGRQILSLQFGVIKASLSPTSRGYNGAENDQADVHLSSGLPGTRYDNLDLCEEY